MDIYKLVVGYSSNELAEQAFKAVVNRIWLGGRVREDQEMLDFFNTVQMELGPEDFLEGYRMQFLRYGERYIFYHYNGSSIEYQGGEISIEFAPIRPQLDQETLNILQKVEKEVGQPTNI